MERLEEAQGFIFDCDGTLLDALDAWDKAEAELFDQAGHLTREQEDQIHSAPIAEAARILHETYGVFKSAKEVLAHLDAHLMPYYREKAQGLPGACEFVRKVSEAGKPCVVVSSSPRRYLEAGLKRVGILDCFAGLVSTEETGCSKQDPAIYRRAIDILGTPLHTTWGVDDAPYAIEVMRDFGLYTIGVGNGCPPERADLLRERSTLYVDTLEELL